MSRSVCIVLVALLAVSCVSSVSAFTQANITFFENSIDCTTALNASQTVRSAGPFDFSGGVTCTTFAVFNTTLFAVAVDDCNTTAGTSTIQFATNSTCGTVALEFTVTSNKCVKFDDVSSFLVKSDCAKLSPTTAAPTNPGNTTLAPTTAAPTNPGNTTLAPTTAAPTTAAPTTAAPTNKPNTTTAPTTSAPTQKSAATSQVGFSLFAAASAVIVLATL